MAAPTATTPGLRRRDVRAVGSDGLTRYLGVVGNKPMPPRYHKGQDSVNEVVNVEDTQCNADQLVTAVARILNLTLEARQRADPATTKYVGDVIERTNVADPAVNPVTPCLMFVSGPASGAARRPVLRSDSVTAVTGGTDTTVVCRPPPPSLPADLTTSLAGREAHRAATVPRQNTSVAWVQYFVGRCCQCLEDVELGDPVEPEQQRCNDVLHRFVTEDVAEIRAPPDQTNVLFGTRYKSMLMLTGADLRDLGQFHITFDENKYTLWVDPAAAAADAAANAADDDGAEAPVGTRLALCAEGGPPDGARKILLQLKVTENYQRRFHRVMVIIFLYYSCARVLDALAAATATPPTNSQVCQANLESMLVGFAIPGAPWWRFNFNFDGDRAALSTAFETAVPPVPADDVQAWLNFEFGTPEGAAASAEATIEPPNLPGTPEEEETPQQEQAAAVDAEAATIVEEFPPNAAMPGPVRRPGAAEATIEPPNLPGTPDDTPELATTGGARSRRPAMWASGVAARTTKPAAAKKASKKKAAPPARKR
jgi:hypothetical protein